MVRYLGAFSVVIATLMSLHIERLLIQSLIRSFNLTGFTYESKKKNETL